MPKILTVDIVADLIPVFSFQYDDLHVPTTSSQSRIPSLSWLDLAGFERGEDDDLKVEVLWELGAMEGGGGKDGAV